MTIGSMGGSAVQNELPESITVLVIGGGPVGIASSLFLSRYGYDSVVLERHATRLGQPKAHVVNSRTAEILRHYGVATSPIRKLGLPPAEASTVRFASSMVGAEFGDISTETNDEEALSLSPEPTFNIPQPILEENLLQIARETGKVTFLRNHEWKGCIEDPKTKEIISTVLIRDTNTTRTIKSKYLIGCDGSGASSRNFLDIPFRTLDAGPKVVLHYASIHFSADLSSMKPGLLWFILNPTNMGIFIAYDRKKSWVFTISYDPTVIPKESITPDYMKDLVFKAIGKPIDDFRNLGLTLWTTAPKVAKSYRSAKISNAFLSGDAAHVFPPTGGLGLNTGIGDVQNLTWKIHAVEQGWVPDSFLDTVTVERLQVAYENSKQSRINEEKIFRLVSLIFKPGATAESLLADEKSREEIKIAIDDNKDHFNSLNLMIGYVYGREPTRGPSDYKPENVPGARLPHAWVKSKTGQLISSLDLVDKFGFTLLAPPYFTTKERFEVRRIPISVAQLDRDFSEPSSEWVAVLGLGQQAAVLIRPDQHIVGSVKAVDEVAPLLLKYIHPTV